ncbi:TIGR03668 family PPOX class F420-dependent oxidoreductase [Streptomyces cyaneochromogenes]|uniref:TIGR03668 family PPOX class F420-dependent oxidoreductase n=1 Tax=Streptomyces cyaneochromogenes TaxID=2496836 RepID=A0A3Q9EL92_9ACTN|nr:TIGR03668 family PPOX class F420-dependent oxidoreductase [Streptomyces cyaneochromogenes]AZQ32735.1 TIGR03668 family PPOX class F420-dependent oxidoreductase [Streptomyces cyaneochromogenes]
MPDMRQDEARGRFAAAPVARLATVDPEGRPHLVPVLFAVRGDEIVTAVDGKPKRSRRLRRLHNIAVSPAVCLLVDEYDDDWDRLWWVRADGGARILQPGTSEMSDASDRADSSYEYAAAIELLRQKYPRYRRQPPDGPVIVITVLHWSGWQASAPAVA